MKLLYVSAKYGLHDYRFLQKLVEDYDVLFLHYSSNKGIPIEANELKQLSTIERKPFLSSFPLATQLGNFKRIYKSFKPDVIHTGYVWQVGILPAVLNLHPHLSMAWGSDILVEPDKSWFKKKLVRKVMKTADHIQCDANFVKERIINDYSVSQDKITVFPWGIDLNMFHPLDKISCRKNLGINEKKFTVLFSRPLEEVYDVPTLMNGLKLFCRSKSDVQILIAHDGPMKSYATDFIKENDLKDQIKLIGWVKHDLIPVLYNASDVYVSTALSDGSSLSLLEAMACGLGLIVTDVPAVTEWVSEENGIVTPKKSPEALSEGLNSYYNNRNLVKTHGQKSELIARDKADWDRNYLKLKEIYEKIRSK